MSSKIIQLGYILKIIRRKAGINQEEFAVSLGVTTNTIVRYEKGLRTPDAAFLIRLVDIYKCDPVWLLTGEQSRDRVSEDPAAYKDAELADIISWLKNNPDDKHLVSKLIQGKMYIKEAIEGLGTSGELIKKESVENKKKEGSGTGEQRRIAGRGRG